MRVIVGLGNPGSRYVHTRHNVGFRAIEILARRWGWELRQATPGLRAATGAVAGVSVVLCQPLEYMNRSGDALARFAGAAAWSDSSLVVVYDDLDLSPAQLRVRRGGGAGGHRGVESIVRCFGSGFVRVRVGVGRPPAGTDAAEHVLEVLTDEDREWLAGAAESAADAVECLLTHGVETAMNRFNVRPRAEREGPAA